jgi:two-component system sensor histidine kinase KdpD
VTTQPAPSAWREALSLVGHELRRPLTVIRGAATLLLEMEDRVPAGTRVEMLGLIDRSVQGMSDLIEDLVVAAQLDAGQLALSAEAVPVDDVLTSAAARACAAEPGRPLRTVPAGRGVTVDADRTQAERALRVLVAHALKRSPPDTAVELVAEVEPERVRLLVRDRGPALPGDSESVFEPFGAGAERSVAGLGLYLARGLARAMGGDVEALSGPGGGSTVSFTLIRRV